MIHVFCNNTLEEGEERKCTLYIYIFFFLNIAYGIVITARQLLEKKEIKGEIFRAEDGALSRQAIYRKVLSKRKDPSVYSSPDCLTIKMFSFMYSRAQCSCSVLGMPFTTFGQPNCTN